MNPTWLDWVRRLQAIAQSGLAYSPNQYDLECYAAVREIAVEMLANGSASPVAPICDLFAGQSGYATPKVDVRAAVFREDRVLLAEEREDGGWTLPGGWGRVAGRSHRARSARGIWLPNARGETAGGVRPESPRHPPIPFHPYKLFFRCELIGGQPASSHETAGVDWFGEDGLPALSTSRVTPAQIHRFFEHYRNPRWPTDFD